MTQTLGVSQEVKAARYNAAQCPKTGAFFQACISVRHAARLLDGN